MGKIVYHGTWSSYPPHAYGKGFHAGTLKSVQDRFESGEGTPHRDVDFGIWTTHAYDIGPETHVDPTVYRDPDAGDTYDDDIWKGREWNYLPRTASGVHQYINDHEDRGSTSYLISPDHPKMRYLGPQFHNVDETADLGHAALTAATVMLGGKAPRRKVYDEITGKVVEG